MRELYFEHFTVNNIIAEFLIILSKNLEERREKGEKKIKEKE